MAKFNPTNEADIAQLGRAVGYSYDTMKVFRDNRHEVIREAVGHNYSANGAKDKVPINLLELAMNIYLQRLVAKNPAVSITTIYEQLKEIATRFELAGNHLIKEIKLGKTLEMVVIGAMISKGIIKVGLNRSTVEVGGFTHDSGQAFADYVSLDDWVEDMTADTDENSQFEGNFYYPTIDECEEMFPNKKGGWTPRGNLTNTEQRDHDTSEGHSQSQREEFRPTIRLLDLFLKKQNLVLRCLASDPFDKENPIEEVLDYFSWNGPEHGMYRKLGFSKIENNTMPVAPAMHWMDIHDLTNRLFRKMGRQAENEKFWTGVRPGGKADGERTVEVNDGDVIALDDPKNIAPMHSGGVSQPTLALVLMLKDLFSYMAGNLDMLGGLGAQSETLGQDQLLSASASMRIQKMQKEVTEFTTGVIEDLMFYLWTDPNPKQIPVVKKVPGFESITITVPFNPDDREGDYLQYNFDIVPYSMQHQSPESKLQGLRTIFMEFVPALTPMMQEQGATINIEKFFKTIGKLSNIKELEDIIEYSTPSLNSEPVGQSGQVRQAPVTRRENVRINRPGATDSGKSAVLQNALLGQKSQGSEVAALQRATG